MIHPGDSYRFSTPAKINLFLRIQRKRTDGYHELLLDFLPISLFDQIDIQLSDNDTLELTEYSSDCGFEDNLVVKAVRILEMETGKPIPLHIKLQKNIPSGAGLGGGSGNAAGILVVLNKLLELDLPEKQLKSLALKLGADVPFFLSPQPSLAKGIGEQLFPLPGFEPLYLILIYPGFSISTTEAYRICRISGAPSPLSTYSMDEIYRLSPEMNDFWIPLVEKYPELLSCQSALINAGACTAGMSGSGSTVFGIFQSENHRDKALSVLDVQETWQVYPCQTLLNYTYPDITIIGV